MTPLDQPRWFPSISARIRQNSPPISVTRPSGSSRLCSGSLDSSHLLGGERDRRRADREVDEEDPAPGEPRGEHTAGERADRDRCADRRAPDPERRAALLAVELLRDQRERGREHHRAADSLHAAGDDQEERVVGEPAGERGDREEDDAQHEDPLAAEEVGERAGGQDAGRQRERVGVDHPLEVGERRVERPLDRRQGDVDDRDVQQQHESGRTDGHERPRLPLHGGNLHL